MIPSFIWILDVYKRQAEHKYDVTDPAILSAIRFHTTGKPDMSLLEKILYVADYIEPRRFKAPNLDKIRGLAFRDLDEAVYEIMSDTLEYLKAVSYTHLLCPALL